MPGLTPEQVQAFKASMRDYRQLGLDKRLFKPQTIPFRSPDEQGVTVQSIERVAIPVNSIGIDEVDISKLVQAAPVAQITPLSVGPSTIVTVVMTLTLRSSGNTLAIPRFSFYDTSVNNSNEIVGASNEWQEISSYLSYQQTRGNGDEIAYKHILNANILNVSGGTRVLHFRGDWLFIGELIGVGTNG